MFCCGFITNSYFYRSNYSITQQLLMKKIPFLVIILTMVSVSAFSQLGVGVKAGVNFSNIDFEDISTDSKTGFHFGVFANLNLGQTFAFQPELLYSTIGAELDGADDIDFHYMQIPLLIQANFSILNLYAGPQIGIITNVDVPEPYDDEFKSTDWSMIFGAGIDLPLKLEVGGRYVYGITDVSAIPDFGSVNNHTWQLYVSWQLIGER